MEIADFLAINVATLYRWKNDHPEFCEALKEAKTEADARVEASLYHRALGYSYDSEEVRVLKDGQIIRVPIREHVPPDTTACIFWLKNRRPERWRDRQDVDKHTEVVEDAPNDERLARALALLLAKAQKRKQIEAAYRDAVSSGPDQEGLTRQPTR
jgi:hypothetical protein